MESEFENIPGGPTDTSEEPWLKKEDKEGRLPRLACACFVYLVWREFFSRQEASFTSKKKKLKKKTIKQKKK